MTAALAMPLPTRVRDLVTALQVPVDGRYWLTRAGIGRPLGLVAPSPAAWCGCTP